MPYELLDDAPQGRYELLPPVAEPQRSLGDQVSQGALNVLAGGVRGAGAIGSTLLAPFDIAKDAIAGKGLSLDSYRQRKADMDAAVQSAGADADSWLYKGAKLGTEVAGTAGVGGMLAKPVQALANTRFGNGIEPLINGVARGLETGGFRVGDLAGTSLALPTRMLTGGVTGAAATGLADPHDAAGGALVGAAFPAAAKAAGATMQGAGALVRRFTGTASPEVQQLAQRAQDLGIQVPADRLVNSRPLNAVAAGLNYVPFSGRAATEEAMNSQLNRALSRTFGQDSSNVTAALRKAEDVLGSQFDTFLQRNTVRVDRQFLTDLADATNRASKELGSDGATIIAKQVDEIMSKAGTGAIDGQAAYNIKKTLDRIGKRNSPEAWYALDLKGKLMEALNRSVGPQEAEAFATVRKQYGSMLDLQKLAANGAEGELSVARVANMKNIRNPEIQELADISAQFVKPREGQHGAAQRAFVGLGGAYLGGPAGLAAGIATGRAANSLLNSGPARRLLMGARPPALPEPELGLLTRGAYRTAPLLSDQ